MIGYQRTRFFAFLFLLLIFEKGKIRLVSVSTSIADTLTSLNKLSSSLNKPSASTVNAINADWKQDYHVAKISLPRSENNITALR